MYIHIGGAVRLVAVHRLARRRGLHEGVSAAIYIYIYIERERYKHICIYIYVTCIHLCIYLSIYLYIYIYTYIHTCIHTYTYIHRRLHEGFTNEHRIVIAIITRKWLLSAAISIVSVAMFLSMVITYMKLSLLYMSNIYSDYGCYCRLIPYTKSSEGLG